MRCRQNAMESDVRDVVPRACVVAAGRADPKRADLSGLVSRLAQHPVQHVGEIPGCRDADLARAHAGATHDVADMLRVG